MLHHEILPILSPKLFGNCRRFFFGVKARIFAAFTGQALAAAARRFSCTWFVPLRSSSQAPFGYAHSSKRRFFSLSWAHQLDEAHFLGRRCDTDPPSRR